MGNKQKDSDRPVCWGANVGSGKTWWALIGYGRYSFRKANRGIHATALFYMGKPGERVTGIGGRLTKQENSSKKRDRRRGFTLPRHPPL